MFEIHSTWTESTCSLTPEKPSLLLRTCMKLLSMALVVLFVSEFVVSITTHCLCGRLLMVHTLVIFLFVVGLQIPKHEQSSSVWLMVSLVAALGLAFVSAIHSIRVFIDPHHLNVEDAYWLIACVFIDVLLKISAIAVGSGRFVGVCRAQSSALHLSPALGVALFVLVRYSIGTGGHSLAEPGQLPSPHTSQETTLVFLDSSLTIAGAVLLTVLLFRPVQRTIFVLLLAVPDGFSVKQFKGDFRKRFPNADCHDLHVYQQSDGRFDVSLHIRLTEILDRSDQRSVAMAILDMQTMLTEVQNMFVRAGAGKVTIQTELVDDIEKSRACWTTCHGDHDCSLMHCCEELFAADEKNVHSLILSKVVNCS